jgi:DNA-binding NarL/FixJ family response regulator
MDGLSEPAVWVDDSHAVLRRGIVSCLTQAGCRVLGESAHFLPDPPLDQIDVLVLEATGSAARRTGERGWPAGLAVVATVRLPPGDEVRALARAGVGAFLDREEVTPDNLALAVRGAFTGTVTVPRDAFSAMISGGWDTAVLRARGLVPRERDVLRLLAEGRDTRSISDELSYSERTVKNIVHDVLVKLDCRTRAQAVGVATRHGLI